MSQDLIVYIVIAILALSFLKKLFPKPKPSEKLFKCAGCGMSSPHTARTIEAWRNNKHRFFCPMCHSAWLKSQPHKERQHQSARSSGNTKSGCLGVVVFITVVPLLTTLLVYLNA